MKKILIFLNKDFISFHPYGASCSYVLSKSVDWHDVIGKFNYVRRFEYPGEFCLLFSTLLYDSKINGHDQFAPAVTVTGVRTSASQFFFWMVRRGYLFS